MKCALTSSRAVRGCHPESNKLPNRFTYHMHAFRTMSAQCSRVCHSHLNYFYFGSVFSSMFRYLYGFLKHLVAKSWSRDLTKLQKKNSEKDYLQWFSSNYLKIELNLLTNTVNHSTWFVEILALSHTHTRAHTRTHTQTHLPHGCVGEKEIRAKSECWINWPITNVIMTISQSKHSFNKRLILSQSKNLLIQSSKSKRVTPLGTHAHQIISQSKHLSN